MRKIILFCAKKANLSSEDNADLTMAMAGNDKDRRLTMSIPDRSRRECEKRMENVNNFRSSPGFKL